jgi:hypothetical protein
VFIGQLFNDATLAPKDLAAAIKYLKGKKQVDATRIAAWAKELHKLTKEPRKITIVKSSVGHSVEIFKDEPNVEYQVLQWLGETL